MGIVILVLFSLAGGALLAYLMLLLIAYGWNETAILFWAARPELDWWKVFLIGCVLSFFGECIGWKKNIFASIQEKLKKKK